MKKRFIVLSSCRHTANPTYPLVPRITLFLIVAVENIPKKLAMAFSYEERNRGRVGGWVRDSELTLTTSK